MDALESKLSAILADGDMMAKLQAMAQELGSGDTAGDGQEQPGPDPAMLQQLVGLAQSSSIDADQQKLLSALHPYLNHRRIEKLQKAMQAAKLAGLATTLLPNLKLGR